MEHDEDLSDLELIHQALAYGVRQRSILSLVERRAAHRELDARLRREARERKKKGGRPVTDVPDFDPAA